MAYLSLFIWSFAAATVLPLASEPLLIALVRSRGDMMAPVLIATAGNFLGACTTYWLARLAIRRVSPTPSASSRRAAAVVARLGQPALLLSWVPLIGDAIVAVAGASEMAFSRFSLWVVVGKLARYLVVAKAASWV